jgi:ribonuclease-3
MSSDGPDAIDALERALGHRFRDSVLLRRALTHASFANENADVEDNEKLEFLGDSVLNFLVTEKLFAAFPLEGEGTLSKARSQLVSEEHFAALARRVGLGSALLLSPGEERSGGRERDARLADAFEAVFAALLLDGGIEAARAATGRLFDADVAALDLGELYLRDPKTALQERAQAEGKSLPVYLLVEESGPPHDRRFAYEVSYGEGISARGEGNSKKDAQRAAADALLKRLEK